VEFVGLFFKQALTSLPFLAGCVPATKGVVVSADHVTVKYRPNDKDLDAFQRWLGRSFEVRINTLHTALDGSIAALGIEVADAELAEHLGTTGHVTLWWNSKFRKPVFARELVAPGSTVLKEVKVIPGGQTVMGKLDFAYDHSGRRNRTKRKT
jgi:hypothetical protein